MSRDSADRLRDILDCIRKARNADALLQQGDQVLEGVATTELSRVNEAHENVAGVSAVERLVEGRVFAVKYRFLQRALTDVVVEGCASLTKGLRVRSRQSIRASQRR